MATNTFKNSAVTGIGTSNTTVYTTPTGKKSMLLQMDVVNTLSVNTPINVDVFVYNAAIAQNVYLFKNVPIATGYPLVVLPSNKKLVLAAGDYVVVKSSVAASANVMISLLEDIN